MAPKEQQVAGASHITGRASSGMARHLSPCYGCGCTIPMRPLTHAPTLHLQGIPVAKGIIEKRLASKEMAKQNKSYATAMQVG